MPMPKRHLPLRILAALSIAFGLSACGRAGAPLTPAPGVTVMPPDAASAEPAGDRPFVLDPLI